MSGLQIFNAHPALYWGEATISITRSSRFRRAKTTAARAGGVTTLFGRSFDTTGLLGASRGPTARWRRAASRLGDAAGGPGSRRSAGAGTSSSPGSSCSTALVYVANLVAAPAISRDLWPSARRSARRSRDTIVDHARLRFPKGDEALRYNVLQKLAYLGVDRRLPDARPGRADDVAGDRRGLSLAARLSSAAGSRRARSISSLAAYLVGFVVVHLVDGAALRRLQQHALDDHRPLSHRGGRAMKR